MRIHSPEIVSRAGKTRIQCRVSTASGDETLWYEVDDRYADWLTPDRLDAFVVALLPHAMAEGERIEVDGAMSELLFYNLTHYFMRLLSILIPSIGEVEIFPREIVNSRYEAAGVGTGFSGGVDSFSALQDHYFNEVPKGFRITHLVFNNIGHHGHGEKGRALFLKRYEMLRRITDAIEIDLVCVDTNIDDVLPWTYESATTSQNLSVPLIFQKLIGKYYYASGYRYEDTYVGKYHDAAIMDPVSVPLLSTETLRFIQTGAQYTRVEKTKRISQLPIATKMLDVCYLFKEESGNCSVCKKCFRTLFTLELLGKLDDFTEVFDLEAYRKIRKKLILAVLARKGNLPFREIAEHIEKEGITLPLSLRILGRLDYWDRRIRGKRLY